MPALSLGLSLRSQNRLGGSLAPPVPSLSDILGAKLIHNWDLTDASSITIATGISSVANKGTSDVALVQTTASSQPAFDGSKTVFDGVDDTLITGSPIAIPAHHFYVVWDPNTTDTKMHTVGSDGWSVYFGLMDIIAPTAQAVNGVTDARINNAPEGTRGQNHATVANISGPVIFSATVTDGSPVVYGFPAVTVILANLNTGDFYEVAIVSPTATDQEKTDTLNFLAVKHGVAL